MTCACRSVTGFGLAGAGPAVTLCYDSGGGTTTCTPVSSVSDLMRFNVPGPGASKLQAFLSNVSNVTIRAWLVKQMQMGTGAALYTMLLSGPPPFDTLTTTPDTGTNRLAVLGMIYNGTGKASSVWANSAHVAQAWVDYQNATTINVWQSIAHVGEAVGLAVGAGFALPAIAGEGAGTAGGALAATPVPTVGSVVPAAPISIGGFAPVSSAGLTALGGVGTVGAAGTGAGVLGTLGTVAGAGGTVLKTAGALQQLSALGKTPGGPAPMQPASATPGQKPPSSALWLALAAAGAGALLLFAS